MEMKKKLVALFFVDEVGQDCVSAMMSFTWWTSRCLFVFLCDFCFQVCAEEDTACSTDWQMPTLSSSRGKTIVFDNGNPHNYCHGIYFPSSSRWQMLLELWTNRKLLQSMLLLQPLLMLWICNPMIMLNCDHRKLLWFFSSVFRLSSSYDNTLSVIELWKAASVLLFNLSHASNPDLTTILLWW